MKLDLLFATPMFSSKMLKADEQCAQLTSSFIRLSSNKEHIIEPRVKSAHVIESQHHILREPEPLFADIGRFIHQNMLTVMAQVSKMPQDKLNTLKFDYESWFTITNKGGYQGFQNHPNKSWKGFLCVAEGEGIDNTSSNAQIRMHDDRVNANFYADPGNSYTKTPYEVNGRTLYLHTGDLVILPGHINYETFTYEGTTPRVILHFTVSIKP